MRCPLYSIAVIAHRGSLHFNLKHARMPPHLKHEPEIWNHFRRRGRLLALVVAIPRAQLRAGFGEREGWQSGDEVRPG